jgi:TonB-linked SusC/RagA family outer membrane protein
MINYSFTRKNLKDCITNHLILKMKLISVFLISAAVQLSASCYAQKVTLQETNASLQTIFLKVYTQTGYQFFYEDELLEKASKISIDVKNVELEYALNKCFEDQPLQYQIVNQTIVVSPKVQPGRTITGRVIDQQGEPQIGVAITIKGTFRGTSTDVNGYFSMDDVEEADILVFSALNLETIEIAVGNNVVINVSMKEKSSLLDEVQIVGYQTTTRRLKTSAVTSLKNIDLKAQTVVSPIQALQGRIAGLSMTTTGSAVGSSPEIQIRGIGTLTEGNQPLIMVDGAIIPNSGLTSLNNNGAYIFTSGMSPYNIVNPNDVESIEVLKDADATAIYGSRGANGVILITTKKAKYGNTKINIEANTGVNIAGGLQQRMTTQEYIQMRKDAFAIGNYNPTTKVAINPITPTTATAPDLLTWDQNFYTDWNNFEFGNQARIYNIQTNISGGTKVLNFYASGGFSRNEDVTRNQPFQQRFSGLLNVGHKSLNDKFSINFSSNFSRDLVEPSPGSGGTPQYHQLAPNMPLTTAEGAPFWPSPTITQSSLLVNPYASDGINIVSNTLSYIGNIDASYKILKPLTLKTIFGYTNQRNNNFRTFPSSAINPLNPGALVPFRNELLTTFQSLNIEPQLIFGKTFNKLKIDALVGTTFFDRKTDNFTINLEAYDSDLLLNTWGAANRVSTRNSSSFVYRFNSGFGRVGLNYDNKYLLNVTYRRDGSSRFGPENKWGDFGSVGIGWIFTNENFIKDKISWLSYGKLRSSYGITGNDNIADFRFTSLFTSSNIIYGPSVGLAPSYLSNPFFQWEETTKLDAAIELGFFKDRLLLNVNWFRNLSTDLLVDQRIPSSTGFGSFLGNFPGVIENKGWEIELTTNNLSPTSSFQWRTNFNITFLKNQLLEYPDLATSPNANLLAVGKPVPPPRFGADLQKTWIFERVDPDTGLPVFKDVNGDGIISTSGFNDRDFVASPIPRAYGGINNSISYKGFSLDFFFQFSQQLVTNHLYFATYPGQMTNPIADWSGNYWKQPGDATKYPRLFSGVGANTSTALMTSIFNRSSAALTDVFYARLKTVSISYVFPAQWANKMKMDAVTIFARGQNLFTWVSEPIYKDPEVLQQRGPIPMSVVTGFNVTF